MAAKKTATTMKLAAVLDMNEATSLHRAFLDARGKNITIDASGVERAGVQCIQVLVAAARAWEADARTFTITALSETFRKTLNLVGVNVDHLLAKESH
ncbi:STAS domain-containing protein [Rhizobiaceae bacterium BDR2-2]|uniref:STAS domain-containing protein n=1 Tax=Ectorhizobium quercum TaxID=2965071 RepID=A0AAE3MWC6_9HYPH|nr:STAS domain-containing protein [Ectorhizobium quercum]MCX8996079.1 STAS domain-containing protein [Ectorhizobium quercum]